MKAKPINRARLVLAEISKTQWEHSSFNAGVIEQLQATDTFVYWLCHRGHLTAYGSTRKRRRIDVPVLAANSRPMATLKYGLEIVVAIYVLAFAAVTRSTLCLLSVSPSTLIFLGLAAKLFGRPFTILVHNEVETLTRSGKPSLLSRQNILDTALRLLQGTRVRVVCLTLDGTHFLRRKYPRLSIQNSRIPPVPNGFLDSDSAESHGALTLGIVGTLRDSNINANIRSFYKGLEQRLHERSLIVDLQVIGGMGLEAETRDFILAARHIRTTFIESASQDVYFARLRRCSHVLFLCAPFMYSVSASSVLVDCASAGVPVLSMPCNYAIELAQSHPALIQVCPGVDDLCTAVVSLLLRQSQASRFEEGPLTSYQSDLGSVILNA